MDQQPSTRESARESTPRPAAPEAPVAVIAGAGRGIGRATAVELARNGYRLCLAARTVADLGETARLASASGDRAPSGFSAVPALLKVPADVSQPADAERLIRSALDRFGRIDALINTAGLAPVRSIVEMTVEEWRAVLDTNLSSAFYLCKAAWPAFERQKGGVVVNVSSLAARDPFPGFAAYGAAKAGLNLFGLSAAREGERIGVRVHTLAPGAVETGMFRQLLTTEQYPPDKTLSPADVARVIADCVHGNLKHTSGEVIYLHRRLS